MFFKYINLTISNKTDDNIVCIAEVVLEQVCTLKFCCPYVYYV